MNPEPHPSEWFVSEGGGWGWEISRPQPGSDFVGAATGMPPPRAGTDVRCGCEDATEAPDSLRIIDIGRFGSAPTPPVHAPAYQLVRSCLDHCAWNLRRRPYQIRREIAETTRHLNPPFSNHTPHPPLAGSRRVVEPSPPAFEEHV